MKRKREKYSPFYKQEAPPEAEYRQKEGRTEGICFVALSNQGSRKKSFITSTHAGSARESKISIDYKVAVLMVFWDYL